MIDIKPNRDSSDPDRNPVYVLIHGFMGSDKIPIPFCDIDFFRDVPAYLKKCGIRVYTPRLPRGGSIRRRSEILSRILDTIDAERIVLIGYSMGGLDARYVAHHHDPDKRISCVTTIATPHRGSILADWAIRKTKWIPLVGNVLCPSALYDMTPESCARFNTNVTDRSDVTYLSWVGLRSTEALPPWLRFLSRILGHHDGANDAQVTVSSAKWGRVVDIVNADHWELIGWNLGFADTTKQRPFSHLEMYKNIVTEIRKITAADQP